MKLNIEEIEDTSKGKIGLLLAHGPTLSNDIKKIYEVSKDKNKFTLFTTGDTCVLENAGYNFDLDYWCIANPTFRIQNEHHKINKYANVKFVYADTMDKTKNVDQILKVDYVPFDQRHFGGKPCTENWKNGDIVKIPNDYYFCCHHENQDYFSRKTIQEYVRDKCKSKERCTTGDTSALHMLSTAIITGCTEIYVFGVDLNYNLGYVDKQTQNSDTFDPWIPRIIDDFRILTQSAKNIGINVFNVSDISPIKSVVPTKRFDM